MNIKDLLARYPVQTSLILVIINTGLFFAQKHYAYSIASFTMNIPVLIFLLCTAMNITAFLMFITTPWKNYPALIISEVFVYFTLAGILIAIIGWNNMFHAAIPITIAITGIVLIINDPKRKPIWPILGYAILFLGIFFLSKILF